MAEEILIRINLQSGEAKSKIDGVKKSTSDLAREKKKLIKLQRDEAVEIAKVKEQQKAQIEINTRLAQSQLGLANSINKTNAANKTGRAQSGLNNAILLETGRLASDASYGFTAIANNLSQVISLFQSFARTNGGVIESFKQLGKSLFGVGGIMIGVQLLISFGPKLLKMFKELSGSVNILKEAFKDAGEGIATQVGNFEIYIDKLQDSTESQEQQEIALKKLKKEFPEFIKQLDESGVSLDDLKYQTEEATAQLDLFKESLVALAMSEAAIDRIRETSGKRIQILVDREREALEAGFESFEDSQKQLQERLEIQEKLAEGTMKDTKGYLIAATARSNANTFEAESIDPILVKAAKLDRFKKQQLKDLDEEIKLLQNFVILQDKADKTGGRGARIFREFRERLFDISKFKQKFDKDAAMLERRTQQELLDLDKEFSIKEAKRRLDRFKEREEKRLEEYKERVKDAKNADVLIANADTEFKSMMIDANAKYRNTLLSIDEGYFVKKQKLSEKERQQVIDSNRAIEDAEIGRLKRTTQFSDDFFDKKIEQLEIDNIVNEAIINAAAQIGLSEAETAEKRKEFALTEMQIADLKLEKELNSIERRKAINLEYVGFAKGISQLLTNLAGEDEKVAKAAFMVEKGAKIADIIIQTQAANAAARAAALASVGTLTGPVEALILRNKIQAGISIATILAQKFKGGGGATGASAGGSGSSASAPINVEAPDFNVVGSSQISQLAQGVSGQVNKPVKAFVVGKEITSQQELDRNINNTAGI